jgi:hypothetical protein
MIKDLAAIAAIQNDWGGIAGLKDKIFRHMFISGPSAGSVFLADCAHNLPFLQACSVLNDVLEQLRDEGLFQCKGRTLGVLVRAASAALPWVSHNAVLAVVSARNDLAHRTIVHTRADCWHYIDIVETELRNWKIIT